jgi:hypothetical protein
MWQISISLFVTAGLTRHLRPPDGACGQEVQGAAQVAGSLRDGCARRRGADDRVEHHAVVIVAP